MLTTSYCKTHTFFNRLEDQFAVGGKCWACKENVDIATESRNSTSLMFLPTSQSLFVFFIWLKHLFPGVKMNKLSSLRGRIYCPNSYTKMDNDSSSLTFMEGNPAYSEVCTGFLCSRGRRVQQKIPMPPCALPQFVTNSVLPGTLGALLGKNADVVGEQSHKIRRVPPELLLSPLFSSRVEMGGFCFCPFLHAIKLSLYCMGTCTIALTISKYPYSRSALRSCSQHGQEEK